MNNYRKPYNKNSRQNNVQVEIGQKFPLTIKRIGINGEGIGYFKRKIVFIDGALPDEVVTAKVTEVTEKYIKAKTVTVREASPDRVTVPDKPAYKVGGMELAHMNYDAQLRFKRDVIAQALEKFQPRGWTAYDLRPTLGMEKPYGYRNKAQFPIRKIGGEVRLGMYEAGSHKLVDLPEVPTQHPATMKVLRQVRELVIANDISIYDEKANRGDLKTLIARVSATNGDVQVTLVTQNRDFAGRDELVAAIQTHLPEVVGIFQNVQHEKTSLIWGERTYKLWGADYIEETVLGKTFQLSSRAFMQLNYEQMIVAYNEALAALDLTRADKLVDAYAGVGTIGITLADHAGEVRGMETIEEAVDDANDNAERNGADNATYEMGTADELFAEWQAEGWIADALVVDPPRTGLEPALRREILRTKPEKFVYISCNASTLARDLVELTQVYDVEYIQSIDMFPQTARWEGVVKFKKRV